MAMGTRDLHKHFIAVCDLKINDKILKDYDANYTNFWKQIIQSK